MGTHGAQRVRCGGRSRVSIRVSVGRRGGGHEGRGRLRVVVCVRLLDRLLNRLLDRLLDMLLDRLLDRLLYRVLDRFQDRLLGMMLEIILLRDLRNVSPRRDRSVEVAGRDANARLDELGKVEELRIEAQGGRRVDEGERRHSALSIVDDLVHLLELLGGLARQQGVHLVEDVIGILPEGGLPRAWIDVELNNLLVIARERLGGLAKEVTEVVAQTVHDCIYVRPGCVQVVDALVDCNLSLEENNPDQFCEMQCEG